MSICVSLFHLKNSSKVWKFVVLEQYYKAVSTATSFLRKAFWVCSLMEFSLESMSTHLHLEDSQIILFPSPVKRRNNCFSKFLIPKLSELSYPWFLSHFFSTFTIFSFCYVRWVLWWTCAKICVYSPTLIEKWEEF